MSVNTVYRYARGPNLDLPLVDGYPNYHFLTVSVDGVKALLESGINPVREVRAADGHRRPLIGIRSSPWKAGTETTPWHDVFDLDHGHVRYFGDHKVSTPGPLGSTTGNAALLEAWELHQGRSRWDRLLAPPVMIFRAVSANGAVKGYVQFCGVAVIERVESVVQSDPQTGLSFPNYVFDLAVADTTREGDQVDWRWIDDRRDPRVRLEESLRFAPSAWREWVEAGSSVIDTVRRSPPKASEQPASDDQPTADSGFDDELFGLITQAVCPGQVIKTLGKARPNRIVSIDREGLRVETDKSLREGRGPQLVPAWMVITAWHHLLKERRLSQADLLNGLNVKRSAFVCALLAHFPGVDVAEDGNIVLRTARSSRDDADTPALTWPTVRKSSDPLARPYTATGRAGKVNVRHFRQTMTHAMDVGGLVWAFFPSREEAELHVRNKVAEGYDSIVVPAKPYIASERPLPIPVGDAVVGRSPRGGWHALWPGGRNYADRLNHLFDTIRRDDGERYTSAEVAEALQADGLTVHADSIDRLRGGAADRPTEALSFALAFFFDVDPDYFVNDSEENASELDPVEDARDSEFGLTQAQLVKVLAGLTLSTSQCLEVRSGDADLIGRLARIATDVSALLLESKNETMFVSTTLAERILTMWAETDPGGNGTDSDYRRAAELFRTPAR